MPLTVQSETPRIRADKDGALRVGDSQVLLELVIRAFQTGATPESIVQRYSTLDLSDVYGAIAYYLRHRAEVQRYLDDRESMSKEVQQRILHQQGDLSEIRRRLQARRST